MVTSPVPVIVKNRILRSFKKAGAINEETAIRLEDIKVKKILQFNLLLEKGIVKKTPDDKYYLNIAK